MTKQEFVRKISKQYWDEFVSGDITDSGRIRKVKDIESYLLITDDCGEMGAHLFKTLDELQSEMTNWLSDDDCKIHEVYNLETQKTMDYQIKIEWY